MDKLHREAAQPKHRAGLFGEDLGVVEKIVLLQLQLHQGRGQRRRVNGDVDLPQQIGYAADMILMTVGQDQAADPAGIVLQIGKIGQDDIHPVHILVGKPHAAVDDKDITAILDCRHVLADLAETAKRNNLQF